MIPFLCHVGRMGGENHIGKRVKGFVGMDPIAAIYAKQYTDEEASRFIRTWSEGIRFAQEHLPGLKTVFADGRAYEKAGGNTVQQLALTMAAAVENIEKLKENGLPVNDIFPKFVIAFAINSNFFMEIAKLRAARMLWGKITRAYGLDPKCRGKYFC